MKNIKTLAAAAVAEHRAEKHGKMVYLLSYVTKAAEAIVETFFDPQTLKKAALDVISDGGMVLEIVEEERGA